MYAKLAAASVLLLFAGFALADEPKDAKKPAEKPEFKLPPGWTEADMQACILAGTPGKMHDRLAKEAGVWQGKSTMWMTPGSEPTTSECTTTISTLMGGRFTKCEMAGEMPGMGPYSGFGLYGYDNVSKKFMCTWIDNHGTGMMTGTGDLSPDGKTLTWSFTFNCPLTQKPAVMREVETTTGSDSKTLEMFGADPKTGKEFKMMSISLTKIKDAPATKTESTSAR